MTIPPPPSAPALAADEPVRKPRSWWRRNLIPLLALVALLPSTAVAVSWQEWNEYYGYGARPITPVLVDPKQSAELGGATWGPVRGNEIEDVSGFDVPPDSRLIGIAVPVSVGGEGISCSIPTLTDQATGQMWESVRTEIGLLYNSDEPESCTPDMTGSYQLIVPFVVPDDVEGPFWVDVWPGDVGGSFLRFPLDP